MSDPIHRHFVEAQHRQAMLFAAANPSLCEILPLPKHRYLIHFTCLVMQRSPGGAPIVERSCDVGIRFDPDYCRRVDPGVVTMLTPNVFHPNMVGGAVCLGRIAPATPLTDILVQVYEMIVWKTFSSQDCLNPDAAQWARNNPERVPLETDRIVRIPKQEELTK